MTTLPPSRGGQFTTHRNAQPREGPGFCDEIWSGKRGSNSRPQPWQGCALPTELFPLGRGREVSDEPANSRRPPPVKAGQPFPGGRPSASARARRRSGRRPSTTASAPLQQPEQHDAELVDGKTHRSLRNSIIDRPIICTIVLNLPSADDRDLAARARFRAIHSRSAEMAISRPTITAAVTITCGSTVQSRIVADEQHQRRGDHQLVGDGIEERAERRGLPELARQIAVERSR